MKKSWILIANRSGARLFENTGPGKGLTLLEAIAHPAGHLKNQDINADKPGRSFDSGGQGRHALGKSESPTEHENERFAKELAVRLNDGRTHNQYSRVVLVAEPGFLGMLRASLDKQTAAMVEATIEKDLAYVPDHAIPASLGDAVKL